MKILIVDDDLELLDALRQSLIDQKYNVDTAADGESALDHLFDRDYDLILLDIMLPKLDGLSVIRKMRQAKIDTPVLMLTTKSAIEDRIKGLDYGADDYLGKPFAVAELMARIRALLRRTSAQRDPVMTVGDISLNTKNRTVLKNQAPIDLTLKEFLILEFLLYNKNRVVSRFTLAEHVWGDEFDPFTMSNFIDVHIKNLRRKIGDAGSKELIRTVRGTGFIIEDQA